MRIAVFSDIHGNCIAFDAILADLQPQAVDWLVCLGDAIQGGPQPTQVVARLRELACPVVMGNADAFLLSGKATDDEGRSPERKRVLDEVRDWSMGQLSDADKAFIAQFQPTIEIPLESDRILLCFHGSPQSFDDIIFPNTPEADVERMLGTYTANILTGGHTHLQQVRRLGAADAFFFNPGSVGLACNNLRQSEKDFRIDPWAEYAVLTVQDGCTSLDFRRVDFDVDALIEIYHASGRPHAADFIAQYGR